jgi:hypothetical protein
MSYSPLPNDYRTDDSLPRIPDYLCVVSWQLATQHGRENSYKVIKALFWTTNRVELHTHSLLATKFSSAAVSVSGLGAASATPVIK